MSNKLTKSEINNYGLYTLGTTLGNSLPMNYITIFMTDHLMISAALTGTILLIARILDFAASLTAGPIVQQSRPKWGKYRSWLIMLRWVIFLGICLQFLNTSGLPLPFRLAIVVAGYFMLHLSMNFLSLAQVGVHRSYGRHFNGRQSTSVRKIHSRSVIGLYHRCRNCGAPNQFLYSNGGRFKCVYSSCSALCFDLCCHRRHIG